MEIKVRNFLGHTDTCGGGQVQFLVMHDDNWSLRARVSCVLKSYFDGCTCAFRNSSALCLALRLSVAQLSKGVLTQGVRHEAPIMYFVCKHSTRAMKAHAGRSYFWYRWYLVIVHRVLDNTNLNFHASDRALALSYLLGSHPLCYVPPLRRLEPITSSLRAEGRL